MSRIADVWATVTDDEQHQVLRALIYVLGPDRARKLVGAIAYEGRSHISGPIAVRRATHALDQAAADPDPWPPAARATAADPYPFLIPDHQAGPRTPPGRCDDCGREVRRPLMPFWDFTTHELRMLGEDCWRDRMLHRGEVAGQAALPIGDSA